MTKFKIGDKVRLVNDKDAAICGFKIGNVYEITNIDNFKKCYIEINNNYETYGYVNDYNIELVEELTPVIDATSYRPYAVNDTIDTKKYDMYIKGIWKNEEEKNMNKVLELYAKRKKEEIDKKYKDKVEKDYNDLELVKQYNEIIKNFEIKMDELYNSELNAGESTIHQCYNTNDYKYELKYDIKNSIVDVYSEEHNKEIKDINDLVEEVEAQLSLSNDLDYQKDILINYSIIDKKSGKIK